VGLPLPRQRHDARQRTALDPGVASTRLVTSWKAQQGPTKPCSSVGLHQ
jgi:hypothetical protein